MIHTFDTEVASYFQDTNCAVIFQNLCYWIMHNKTNEKNRQTIEIDGVLVERYFTFNSIQAFSQQFSYFSKKQIENYLKKLYDNKFIAKGNFNSKGFDRTSWYCLVDEEYWMDKYLGESEPRKKENQNGKGVDDGHEKRNYPAENTRPEENSLPESEIPTGIPEIDTVQPENLQSFHFPKRGNAFPENGKSTPPKGEMHFLKTGNAFPQNGEPIPDINSYLKPNNKHISASAASVRTTLFELDHTLVLDAEFYPAAAEFLQFHNLGEEYLRWFYQNLKASKHITNLPGYFFKVFFKTVYVERYKAFCDAKKPTQERIVTKDYICPVCGEEQQITPDSRVCDCCESPVNPSDKDIARYKVFYRMDEETKNRYISARSKILFSGGNVSQKLVELDEQFGIVS